MGPKWRRLLAAVTAALFVASIAPLAAPAAAGACEENQIAIAAIARGYDSPYGRFLDGVVTNDSSVTVTVDRVDIAWAEDADRVDQEWVGCALLAPGEWTTFHDCWPDEVPATWTPNPHGVAYPAGDDAVAPLALQLDGVTGPVDDEGIRVYTATVTNTATFTVSDVDLVGRELDATSSAFVDSLFSWDMPDSIAPGASVEIPVRGKSPWDGELSAEMRFTALEQPVITLTPSTLQPFYGSPVAMQIDLRHEDGSPVLGEQTVKIFRSIDGQEWRDYKCYETDSGSVSAFVTPERPTYYKAVFWGGDGLGCAESDVVRIEPKVAAIAPTVPSLVHAARPFPVRGRMCAGAKSDGKRVVVFAEKRVGGSWKRRSSFSASANAAGSYRVSVKLASGGTWRIRAFRSGAGYSPYRKLSVRRN